MSRELVRVEIPGRWAGGAIPEDFPGRALQAWLYGQLAALDERLAADVHDANGEKPFHIALPRDGEDATLVVAGYGPLAEPVLRIAERMGGRVLLNAHWWEATAPARVRCARWAEVAEGLLAIPPARVVRMRFLTPATFRSAGNYLPLPVPQTLFGSLLERWRAWSPVDLGPGADEAVPRVALRRHRLQSVAVQLRGLVPAFVGAAEFEMRERSGPYAGLPSALAAFAAFAGVGAKVSAGFGCVAVEAPVNRAPAVDTAAGSGQNRGEREPGRHLAHPASPVNRVSPLESPRGD